MKNAVLFYLSLLLMHTACSDEQTADPDTLQALNNRRSTSADTQMTEPSELTGLEQRFSVQVAALSDEANVTKIISRMQQAGVPAYITADEETQGVLFRVRLGPFSSEAQAMTILQDAKEMGYAKAFILTEYVVPGSHVKTDITEPENKSADILRKQLTSTGVSRNPQWSPNGREIAFHKTENKVSGIYAVGTGGGLASKIVNSTADRTITDKFAWDPSGRRIAFVANEITRDWDSVENLYVIDKSGANFRPIIEQERFAFQIENLRWSPSASHLAFNANYDAPYPGASRIQQIVVLETGRAGRNADVFDFSLPKRSNWVAGWRNRNELLFISSLDEAGGNWNDASSSVYEVWSWNAGSGEKMPLLGGLAIRDCQNIKAIGRRIVYFARSSQDDRSAYIAELDMTAGIPKILFDDRGAGTLSSNYLMMESGSVYFKVDGELWRNEDKDNVGLQLHFTSDDFTISPREQKICFAEGDFLYIADIVPMK